MDELTALVDAPLDNDVKTVATADRNRQKHNISRSGDRSLSRMIIVPFVISNIQTSKYSA